MKNTVMAIALIAAIATVVIGGTSAFFSDSETSTGNTFAAGTLDLKVDGNDLTPSSTPLFTVTNLKPGDKDGRNVRISNDGTVKGKAVYVSLLATSDNENTCTEPEINDTDLDDCSAEPTITADAGELCKNIEFNIKDGDTTVFPVQEDGRVREYGSFTDAHDILMKRGLNAESGHNIKINYRVSESAGNEIQDDSCVVDIKTTLQQEPTATPAP